MNHNPRIWLGAVAFVLASWSAACSAPAQQLRWQKFTLTPEPTMQPLLTGAPQTGGMRSGRVWLKPGEEMHATTPTGTRRFVFLAGRARVLLGVDAVEMECRHLVSRSECFRLERQLVGQVSRLVGSCALPRRTQ